MSTGFFSDERCFWHAGGNYAFTMPIGGLVQPQVGGGLPENPETKRRLKNLLEVTGLMGELNLRSAEMAGRETLELVHPAAYLDEFKRMSDAGGGELGLRTPFAQGGYEIAALSAGLAVAAVEMVSRGALTNAYALSRPPGHHCLPNFPNGFCLLANIAIAIEAARAQGLVRRVAVLDWDVHHGNGTEAIYYARDDVLTISLHQEGNYPLDTGALADRGKGAGEGYNINLPMHAGSGHSAYLHAMDRVVIPAIEAFKPDLIIVACGYDAAIVDPLARMQATAETFAAMTARIKTLAERLCGGRLVLVHEGGYSEAYVPFCGHATIATLAGSTITAPDPLAVNFRARQPSPAFDAFLRRSIDEMAGMLGF
ncbi:class II histone deacetylase [Sulfitobacter aestuarii]|uniref:Class II histone deacetylase n=1 Tax=Sulfitobacter aestuarii TaxID=2161676 RepID=A0ABW5U346_9RHOB